MTVPGSKHMTLPEIEADREFTIHILSSTSGAALSFLISLILFIDVARVCYKIPKSPSDHHHDKTKMRAYTLALAYFGCTTIASGSYSFIRTNTFTRIQSYQFTPVQCMVGYLGSYLAYYLSLALLYVTFVWRVDTSFRNSTYSISRWILNAFYVVIPVVITVLCCNAIIPLFVVEWMVYTHKSSNLSMCVNGAVFPTSIDRMVQIISGFQSVFMFTISAVLLWMFTSGLWRVNKGLIRSYITDVERMGGFKTSINDGSDYHYNSNQNNIVLDVAKMEDTRSANSGQSVVDIESGDTPDPPSRGDDHDDNDTLDRMDSTPKTLGNRTISDLKDSTFPDRDRLDVRQSSCRSSFNNNNNNNGCNRPSRIQTGGSIELQNMHSRSVSNYSRDELIRNGSVTPQAMTMIMEQCTNESIQSAAQRRATIKKVEPILKLHDLIKKQTILVSISVISSVLLWSIIVVNDWVILNLYWDVSVNVLCVWLMLASSKQKWKWCTQTILRCFYLKENQMARNRSLSPRFVQQ